MKILCIFVANGDSPPPPHPPPASLEGVGYTTSRLLLYAAPGTMAMGLQSPLRY